MRTLYLARSILLCLSFLGLAAAVRAQEGDANLEFSTDYDFGEALRFNLVAENIFDVERVTLSLRPELSTELYVVDIPLEAGKALSVTHTIDVDLIELRPFSSVNYFWQVETDSGTLRTAEQSFAYEDDRFAWQQTARGATTVHWTSNGPAFGQDVLNVVDQALLSLSTLLPLESIYPFDIYVYPSAADLRTGVEQAGTVINQSSQPDLDVILVTAVNPQSAVSDLEQSIPTELTRLLIAREAGENLESFPWWLLEGIGSAVQPRPSPSFAQLLDDATENDSAVPLWQLCEAPSGTNTRVMLARAQSLAVVMYIRNRFGDQKLAQLVESYAKGRDCPSGVEETLGVSLDQLHETWLKAYREPPALKRFLNEFGLWILIILAGFGLAWILIRYSTKGNN